MQCPDADLLAGLLGGSLSEDERAQIANHAATCENCHALVEDLVERSTVDGSAKPSTPAPTVRGSLLVGRYLVGEALGTGGMGLVFAASDTELHRRVAVKLLRPDLGTLGGERMLREARTLARLSNPHIVTVFDVGEHEGHPFIAMELVDGGSLADWVRSSKRSFDERLDRMLEAGRGLAAAHAIGVVHRDVKPENILVGTDGRARVTDFGLAYADSGMTTDGPPTDARLTRTGTLMGTPAYMAPEQVERGPIDARTDQWSFCATLYEVLTGTRPFPSESRASAIESGRLASGRAIPGWVRQIAARGLRANPAERWPSMDALVRALARGRRRRRQLWIGGIAIVPASIALALVAHEKPPPLAPPSKNPQRWVDGRTGCNCPYSACEGTCVSVCRAPAYTRETPVPGVNGPRTQEALLGASRDGATLLYLTGKRCSLDHLMLARRNGATYDTFDLTSQLDHVPLFEGCCTLAADGESVMLTTENRRGFVRSELHGAQLSPPGAPELSLTGAGTIRFPVLSNDGLTLYYRLDEASSTSGQDAMHEGSYASTRRSLQAPFGSGRRLTGRANFFEYVTSVSSDGLSLFMAAEFQTRVLVRSSVDQPFGDPAFTLEPARMQGWRAIPLADCSRIVTTSTPGGCEQEDIVFLDPT